MKYLKIKNTPLSMLRDAKYNNGNSISGELPWQTLGFNPTVVKLKALQYTDASGDFVQVLPISVKGTFDAKFITPFTEDCAEYELAAPEVIDEAAYQIEKTTAATLRAAAATIE